MNGSKLHFDFQGKSGKEHHIGIRDPRAARVIRQCQELPGQELFQYVDDEGNQQSVGSADVNDYVYQATGKNFTAKDFRTWGGTVAAVHALQHAGPAESERDAQKKVVEAVKMVAERLGNTPATCRDYYIHPTVIDAYKAGELFDIVQEVSEQTDTQEERQPEERVVLRLLRRQLAQETQ